MVRRVIDITKRSTTLCDLAPAANLSGTGDRLVGLENAAIALAEVIDDLARDMATITLNMGQMSKRTHELTQTGRARGLAGAIRAAVAASRCPDLGSLTALG
jgi:hypothetical protein